MGNGIKTFNVLLNNIADALHKCQGPLGGLPHSLITAKTEHHQINRKITLKMYNFGNLL